MDKQGVVNEQTPEIFRLKKYYKANMALMPDKLCWVKGLAEPALKAGLEVVTVDGDDRNFRVTTETDLERYMQLKSENRV